MEIIRVTEVKKGSKYETTHTETNAAEIYKSLANDLIAKKINNCTYIKSVKREPLYNGFNRITVTYDNGCRSVYTIESN